MFRLREDERAFYAALTEYVLDGYNVAAASGGKSRAIGFVMTVFQKIAASSFAAVRRTLERRLLSLTVQEAIIRDAAMDVPSRDLLLREARDMLIRMNGLDDSPIGRAEADRMLADVRLKLMKKLSAQAGDTETLSEAAVEGLEDAAALLVEQALPQERERIRDLLELFPDGTESKTTELLHAIQQIWDENPAEKIIVFTTYLGGSTH